MHGIKALVITCIDFRFQKTLFAWLEKNDYLGQCDILSIAGSSRDLVEPIGIEHQRAAVRHITLSVDLHQPKEILVFDHQDCGGYTQNGTVGKGLSRAEDFKRHLVYFRKTRSVLSEVFPNISIRTFYADLEGIVEEIF